MEQERDRFCEGNVLPTFTMFDAMTLSIATLSITTLSITTFSIMTLSTTTLSIMILSIMTLGIMIKNITLSINETQHNNNTKLRCNADYRVYLLLCSVSFS
jgi:hypothetical protein